MKQFKLLALVPAMFLAACGGDEQSVEEKAAPGSVTYSYPADGQADVSPKTDIILRFSHPVTDNSLNENINLKANGDSISFNVEKVDGGKSLKLTTPGTLMNGVEYSITFEDPLQAEGGRIIETPNSVGKPGIQFHTRGSFSGVASEANTQNDFKIAWSAPSLNKQGAEYFETMDFSTFRIAMTQPIHPEWKKLGGSIELRDKNGDLVPATILVKGNRISVDPCVADRCGSKEDILKAGETYTLELSNLASLNKDTEDLSERFKGTFPVMPKDTGSTVVLQQSAADSNQGRITSILNGQAINSVTLNSVLQGKAGPSQQGGDLFAELAPNSPDMDTDDVLLRIPKGSVLESTSLNVKVGGKVQVLDAATGDKQETGTIKVTMLSDATGYMRSNPYTDELDAPRHLTLFMDASMNTEEAQPNAALSQDLMSIQLRGTAEVIDGVLTIDAIGMVEPELLGQEFTDSTIAFHLKADTDVNSALDAEDIWKREQEETTPPELVSWMPGDKENAIPNTRQSMQRPGDPVILFFDEPLDPASVGSSVSLTKANDSSSVAFNHILDGTTLTILPEEGFEQGVSYAISVDGISDLSGNSTTLKTLNVTLEDAFDPVFAPGEVDEDENSLETLVSPVVLTSNAGFACATTEPNLKQGSLSQGHCLDGAPDDRPFPTDELPIIEVGSDQPLSLVFSQSIDPETLNKDTLKVERVTVDSSGNITDEVAVDGRYQLYDRAVKFFPDNPWSNTEKTLYRYTLKTKTGKCNSENPNEAVCSVHGAPLNTSPLVNPLQAGSSEPLISYFRGAAPTGHVMTPLHNVPVRDVNSNYWIDTNEPFPMTEDELVTADEEGSPLSTPYYPTPSNAARLVVSGKPFVLDGDGTGWFGCDEKGTCPENQFIYKTAGLLTEVVGPVSENPAPTHPFGEGEKDRGIRVLLHPAALITTGAELHLENDSGASISHLLLSGGQSTGPQILRMRYAKDKPECDETQETCKRNRLIEGRIIETPTGPKFRTKVDLFLDAPALTLPLDGLAHNLFSHAFTLDLEGDITFFDDGRMQIEQRNLETADIMVSIKIPPTDALNNLLSGLVELINITNKCTGPWYDICYVFTDRPADDPDPLKGGAVSAHLQLLPKSVYLNYISNPVKDLPAQYQEQIAQ